MSPTTSTPVWSAPHNGILGDASAIAGAGQINQFLGTHADTPVYQGNPILAPAGAGASAWAYPLATFDIDQPFTMSGSTIGRVAIPLLPVGEGADLLVSLCADNAGQPGTVIIQTRIPASWIYQLAAVAGTSAPSSQAPITEATGNPLAVAQFNTLTIGPYTTGPFSPPATGSANIVNPSTVQAGAYLVNVGGTNQNTGAVVGNVFAAPATGTTLAPLVPSAVLPQTSWTAALAATTDTLVLAGGYVTSSDTAPTTAVFAASWNPSTGAIGAWSSQAALPVGSQYAGVASWGETVYILGGVNASGYLNNVYYATVSNNQVTGWSTASPLPQRLSNTSCVALNGFLFVIGGENSGGQSLATYYAAIRADGSLGAWIPAPPLPSAVINGGNQVAATSQALIVTGNDTYVLGVTAAGPAPVWTAQNDINFTSQPEWVLIPAGGADYTLFTVEPLNPLSGRYRTAAVTQTPVISVPLPVSGLTNGVTYHLVLQQQGGDANNYLRTSSDLDVYAGNPTLLTSSRGAYTWSAATPAGTAIPVQVFDNSVPYAGANPLHLWVDSGARVTTVVSATTPDLSVLGLCEAVRQSVALNSNQGFESGLSPWTVTGGTAAQSSAEVYEGAYAAQVTPSGSASSVSLQSELLPCMPGQSVTATGWMWFTSSVASNASMSVTWYTLGGSPISTSSNNVSAPAATWTQVSNTFTAPATAYGFTINPTLAGTPAAGQVFYVDTVHAHYTYTGPQASTVTQIQYAATWPDAAAPVGSGTVQLA